MAASSHANSPQGPGSAVGAEAAPRPEQSDRQLYRWGGFVGLAGVGLMIGTATVVGVLGLPDASDVETLRDFADIETGRILEHVFYLGALVMFALHVAVLGSVLAATHRAAALFGSVLAEFGLVIMAASSVLHVSTSPLSELYVDPETPAGDLASIEYAWHGAQSVFDTMLATGLLLVPIGVVLFGIAMWSSPEFSTGLARFAIVVGTLGFVGAVIEAVAPELEFSAVAVLAIVLFHLSTGWRTLAVSRDGDPDAGGRRLDLGP